MTKYEITRYVTNIIMLTHTHMHAHNVALPYPANKPQMQHNEDVVFTS